MSEIVSSQSGPQGTASSEEVFSEPSSPEFGHESNDALGETGDNEIPRGTNGNEQDGRPKSAAQKKIESRYERTKRERAAFRQQQEAFRAQQTQFANERAQFEESKRPKRDYSLADLKKYRGEWKKEAEETFDDSVKANREALVRKADAEIAAMEAEEAGSKMTVVLAKRGTPEHRQQWESAERELSAADPEFMKPGTKLDKKLREIFAGANADAYRDHPQGIYAAYDRAKREILEEDNKGLRTKLSQLEKELQRFGGLTSIGSGVPGRVGDGGVSSTADFARLSSAEMRKHLLAASKRGQDSSGWL